MSFDEKTKKSIIKLCKESEIDDVFYIKESHMTCLFLNERGEKDEEKRR
jgi:hypothetical protein